MVLQGDGIFGHWHKEIGKLVREEHDLKVHTAGIAPLPHFAFDHEEKQAL